MKREKGVNHSQMDILSGSIVDKLILFALPLAFTGMLQQLFNAADVAVVGRFVGKEAMAAVGSNSAIIGLLVNGFVGLALGANVAISTYIGQKRPDRIHNCIHTSVLFSLIGGVFITAVGEIVAPILIDSLSVPSNVYPMALAYLRIYLLGMPVIFLYNFEAAIFRSQGDTKTPLICLIISGVLNFGLNLLFVRVFGMDADGVALATVISNLASSVLLFILLVRRSDAIKIKFSDIRIHKTELIPMIKIGLPAGLQSMVFSISNICIQSAINKLGSDVMAASAAAFNIEILAYYLLNSFGQGCTTFVGQNYGAGNISRCRKVTRISLIIDVAVTTAISLIILYFGKPLLGIFNSDSTIKDIGFIRLAFILSAEGINAVMEIMSGAMRGYGHSLSPALITFFGVCGIRIAWVYTIFAWSPKFITLMLVYPISWVATAIALVIAYILFMRHFLRTFIDSKIHLRKEQL